VLLRIREAKEHADTIVATRRQEVDDRSAAEALKGARIFVPRSSFPTAGDDEYYWVDLLGLDVVNREGVTWARCKRPDVHRPADRAGGRLRAGRQAG
jgi:16S rRNA processing protein RimM